MIIRVTFRRPGKLARHLCRGDTNEKVIVRDDLSGGCDLEIPAALNDFAALGSGVHGEKSLIHFVVSPSIALSADDERQTIDEIRKAYGISIDQPRLVVQHHKPGDYDRPPHYHVVFPRRDISSGLVIRDSFFKSKNDRLSVQLDAAFDAPAIIPIVHKQSAEQWLARNKSELFQKIEDRGGIQKPSRKIPDTPTAAERKRAVDAGIDIADFSSRVLSVCEKKAPNDLDWTAAGLRLACGDKCVMVVDIATGHCAALSRTMNADAKRRGMKTRWKDSDVRSFLNENAPNLSTVIGGVVGLNETCKESEDSERREQGKRRGRPHLASQDAIAAERARIAADVAEIKRRASEHRQKANLTAMIRAIKPVSGHQLAFVAGAGLFLGGGFGAAAAIALLAIIKRGAKNRLAAQREAAFTAGDARAQIEAYFSRRRNAPLAPRRRLRQQPTISPER